IQETNAKCKRGNMNFSASSHANFVHYSVEIRKCISFPADINGQNIQKSAKEYRNGRKTGNYAVLWRHA
ncbi:MAG: hypothetical protein IKC53_10705, partial [Lentisphaeria bacterium]|nr:hypothetical protein [Lentisphaeria bacterium]